MNDLVVLGQDPRFGGGVAAQLDAFLDAARALGRPVAHVFDPHPTFDGRRVTVDRVEAVRQWRSGRRLEAAVRHASSLWVVSTLATHGLAAARSHRPYGCWIGAALADEWRGRAGGLDPARRRAQDVSRPLLRRVERRVLQGADRVYATSEASRAAVAAAGELDEAEVGILPIPVDIERFSPEAEERWLARLSVPTIAFVGRADDPRKNVDLLLRAFVGVRRELAEARISLVGRPPARPVTAGVDVRGIVPSVPDELRSASVLVLPSFQEGFGIVVAEALASGVPVVVTPSGGPEHLVRESGGGIVLSSFDVEELREALVGLLRDAARLRAMRLRGREYVVREHSQARFRELLGAALDRSR
jgi:glycosyltransferase involved in cell wall biosynthesis